MKRRTIAGLMFLGVTVTAGAYAQSPDYGTRYGNDGYQTERYDSRNQNDGYRTQRTGNRYENDGYNYNRDNGARYDGYRYDKRTVRQMRRSSRNNRYGSTNYNNNRYDSYRNGTTGYNDNRYDYNRGTSATRSYAGESTGTTRYMNGDNDRYINDIYGDNRNMGRSYDAGRGSYDRYDGTRYYDKRTLRQMRKNERHAYKSRYSNQHNDRAYRGMRNSTKGEERGIFRNRRMSNDNGNYRYPAYDSRQDMMTPSSYNRYDNDRNYRNSSYDMNRGYSSRMGVQNPSTGYSGRMDEGQMDYDTWMRHRDNSQQYQDTNRRQRNDAPRYEQRDTYRNR